MKGGTTSVAGLGAGASTVVSVDSAVEDDAGGSSATGEGDLTVDLVAVRFEGVFAEELDFLAGVFDEEVDFFLRGVSSAGTSSSSLSTDATEV